MEGGKSVVASWEKQRTKKKKKTKRRNTESNDEGGEKGVEGRPVESPGGRKKG